MILGRRSSLPVVWLIPLAVVLVYAHAVHAPFVFDDVPSIEENATIRRLWPLSAPLSPPGNDGLTVSGRPLLNLSLALNYAVSGLNVWSYHVFNVLIHAGAALALFGLVRRTLGRPPLAMQFGRRAVPVAFLIAALWALHPLQTESVTYVVQRAESLMGFFFLLSLYAFVRSVESSRPAVWRSISWIACALGVATKEVAALVPVMVFLYDRTFVAGTLRRAWQYRRGFYMALAATWLPLTAFIAAAGGNRGGTVGFDVEIAWMDYWLTQCEALSRYLWLAVWPHPLVFDYGKLQPPETPLVFAWALPIVALACATVVALRRWPAAGFLGAWFFGLLAPTSVVPNALQMIVEHRVYLPLAAVVAALVCLAARHATMRALWLTGAALFIAAGVVTANRNAVYRAEETLWRDTIAKRPGNARAHNNLGRFYVAQGRVDEGIAHFRQSLRFDPTMPTTHFNLGASLARRGKPAEAVPCFEAALQILPDYADAHLNLGNALVGLGEPERALRHYTAMLRSAPATAELHFRRGVALARLHRWQEAIADYAQTIALEPGHVQAHTNWGAALLELNAPAQAIEHFEAALRVAPELVDVRFNLALASAALDRRADAIRHYRAIVATRPDHADAQLNLGIALAQMSDVPGALAHLQEAARLRPESAEAHTNLGIALGLAGRAAESLAEYEAALRLRPNDPQMHYSVGYALLELRRWAEARRHFEAALRLQPGFPAAQEILNRLRDSGVGN